jgi:hypothetical protein
LSQNCVMPYQGICSDSEDGVKLCWLLRVDAPAGPARHNPPSVPEVGRKQAMEAGEIESWAGHQGRQACHEIQRLPYHLGGAIPERPLVAVDHPALPGPIMKR